MDIKENNKKYQTATYINEERFYEKKYNKKGLQSKIVFTIVCSIMVALILAIIGFFVYQHVTGPSLEKMMNYMEEKYGEEFEILAVGTEPWFEEYFDITVESSKFPDDIITVRTYREHGERIYEDNYIELLKREEFNAAFQKVVSGVYGECKVYVSSVEGMTTLPPEIDLNTKVEDILSNPNVDSMINIYIEGDESKKDEQIKQLIEELKQRKWSSNIDIYYLNKGNLSKLTDDNRGNKLKNKKGCNLFGRILLSRDFDITSLRWEVEN